MLPATIHVDVRPYDDSHRALLERLPNWQAIEAVIANGLDVAKEQFLVYALFRAMDTQTLDGLRDLSGAFDRLLCTTIECSERSFCAHPRVNAAEHRPETQAIGESLGLCFMDAVFGTNETDWERIPEGADKTLDYVASNGEVRLEVEAKGSIVENRWHKSPSVSAHKADVTEKKEAAARHDQAIRVGTIAAIDRVPGGAPILWLLDPPVAYGERTPREIQVLHRMGFVLRIISLISPRSALAAALATRLADLRHIRDMSQLDGVPLMAERDAELAFKTDFGATHSRFFGTKSVIQDGPAGGVVVRTGREQMLFAGVRQKWIDLALSQDFTAIREYQEHAVTIRKSVTAMLPSGRFRAFGFDRDNPAVRKTGSYYKFTLAGDIHYSVGGLVFGWLPIPAELR